MTSQKEMDYRELNAMFLSNFMVALDLITDTEGAFQMGIDTGQDTYSIYFVDNDKGSSVLVWHADRYLSPGKFQFSLRRALAGFLYQMVQFERESMEAPEGRKHG